MADTKTDPKQAKLLARALDKGTQIARSRSSSFYRHGKDIIEIRHAPNPTGYIRDTKISTRILNALPKYVKPFKGMGAMGPPDVRGMSKRVGTSKATGGAVGGGQEDVNVPSRTDIGRRRTRRKWGNKGE